MDPKNEHKDARPYACWEQLGQGALVAYIQKQAPAQRRLLLKELNTLQPGRIQECQAALSSAGASQAYEPAAYIPVPSRGGDARLWARATDQGESLLRSAQVAVMTLAGGLGTRLGLHAPKGLLTLNTLEGERSLFALFAQKLLQARALYCQQPLWVVLTSPLTHAPTRAYFKQQRYFGLDPKKIYFITQRNLPFLDAQGQLLLKSPESLYQSPDGHGGALCALQRSGCLQELKHQGVKHLSVFQVDNPLSPFLEPAFLGLHEAAQAPVSCRVLIKEDPDEALGLFCQKEGRTYVAEYHQVPKKIQAERTSSGSLRLCIGNLGLYLLGVDFLLSISGALPLHCVPVNVQTLNPLHPEAEPAPTCAFKFERYLFDVLPLANKSLLIEALRSKSFAPIKSPHGAFSPQAAQAALRALCLST